MSRISISSDQRSSESGINPWLWAQLATAFLFGALVTLLVTTPRREHTAAPRNELRPEPLSAVHSAEPRNVSQGSSRQVKPVELHRETTASPESPRHQEAAVVVEPTVVAQAPPPVHVALDRDGESRPNYSDLIVNGPILGAPDSNTATTESTPAPESVVESDAGSPNTTTENTADDDEETTDDLNTTTTEPEQVEEPVAGREARPGEVVEQAPANHVDPSIADMSNVGQRQAADLDAPPAKIQRELTAGQVALRNKLKACLDYYYREPVTVGDYAPWGIMHALIAYGVDTNVYADGHQVNAIGWLAYNGRCHGQRLFVLNQQGKIDPLIGVGVQGHPGQFLSMLAQSRVRTDYPIRIEDHEYTVADLIQREQETCRVKTELTFKLIAMSHYLDTDTKWKSDTGEDWDIPKLIREELASPIVGAACGGTHRLTGFSYAVNKRVKEGKPLNGQWERARRYLDDYKAYTFRLQNSDGSFSSNWFAGRGDWGGPVRKLETTGHISEWLISACNEEELADPRLVKALNLLADTFLQNRGTKWEIGPRGHGLHALVMYDERVYGAKPGERRLSLASRMPVPAPTIEPKPAKNPAYQSTPADEGGSSWFFRRR